MSHDERTGGVLWRRLDLEGHEAARLGTLADGHWLSGSAVFADTSAASGETSTAFGDEDTMSREAPRACRFDYAIGCDSRWRTRSVLIDGSIGAKIVRRTASVDPDGHWICDRKARPDLEGCLDVDLAFSPSTNTLPLRRLDLAVGARATLHVAWLRFPELVFEPKEQTYTRLDATHYRFESDGGAFRAEIEVDTDALVVRYPGLWERIAP